MSLKFTKSVDGILRATIRVSVRLTKDEIEEIMNAMKSYDGTRNLIALRNFLDNALQVGIEDGLDNYRTRREKGEV